MDRRNPDQPPGTGGPGPALVSPNADMGRTENRSFLDSAEIVEELIDPGRDPAPCLELGQPLFLVLLYLCQPFHGRLGVAQRNYHDAVGIADEDVARADDLARHRRRGS